MGGRRRVEEGKKGLRDDHIAVCWVAQLLVVPWSLPGMDIYRGLVDRGGGPPGPPHLGTGLTLGGG